MIQLLLAVIYISFISLGLPDSLLGSAWPVMYPELGVPVSYAGIISMIIAAGTVVSSLQSDRLTKRFGTGKVTVFSVVTTAVALLGFSISHSFLWLCVWAIPYGLGAGSVDASLNNYVALHYASRHMSWLHCMWGLGASVGPYVMSWALTGGQGWNMGYRYIGLFQVVLTAILFLSLPLWKKPPENNENVDNSVNKTGQEEELAENHSTEHSAARPLTLREILRISGAKEVMVCFFCYCALEQTAGLWASSYLVLHRGIDSETAASYASLFYLGITAGRALSGFLTMKWNDRQMVRLGQAVTFVGIVILLLPEGGNVLSMLGLILTGMGCAPVYPCIIHSTPERFGADKSQAIIGVQMASAYVGTCLMPPLFGILARSISIMLFPVFLLLLLVLMFWMHELLYRTRVSKDAF